MYEYTDEDYMTKTKIRENIQSLQYTILIIKKEIKRLQDSIERGIGE